MGYTEKGIGYQHRDTSLAAAEDNEGKKLTLREQVYQLLLLQATASRSVRGAGSKRSWTAHDVSVQPRISELSNESRVEDSGKRGKTQWGKSCILWQVRNARV
jgi:hypothetical protein